MSEHDSRVPALVRFVTEAGSVGDLELFHFDGDRPNFESLSHENGFKHWLASDLMKALGYSTMHPILKAVNNAISACAQLEMSIPENFEQSETTGAGKDWKLSRFGCYLTVMNGDPKNMRVAEAQAYFVTIADAFQQWIQEAESVDRVIVRGEVSEREKALSGTAHVHGVENYRFFQNAGYRGLYNLDLKQIRQRKGVPDGRSPLDFMGKTELAANLFRVTQTDEKIRNDNVRGQEPLERVSEHVGRAVRKTMIDLGGTPPERLPAAQDIKRIRSDLKKVGKEYAKLDGPRKK